MSEPIIITDPGSRVRPFTIGVDPAWLDYNEHVNEAAYAAIAALANEELCVDVGMSEAHRTGTGRAFYSAQLTINYLHEITATAEIRVLRTITRLGTKSMTVATEFRVDDRPAARIEHVYVLVDSRRGTSVPLDADERARIAPLVGRQF